MIFTFQANFGTREGINDVGIKMSDISKMLEMQGNGKSCTI